jgi:hypothetical protein
MAYDVRLSVEVRARCAREQQPVRIVMQQNEQQPPNESRSTGAASPGGTERVPTDAGRGEQRPGTTPSDAPNNSFETGAGAENTGLDSPAIGSHTLSNEEYLDLEGTRPSSSTTGETRDGIEPGDASHEAE